MKSQLFCTEATIIVGTHLNLKIANAFHFSTDKSRISESFSNLRSAKSRVVQSSTSGDLARFFLAVIEACRRRLCRRCRRALLMRLYGKGDASTASGRCGQPLY